MVNTNWWTAHTVVAVAFASCVLKVLTWRGVACPPPGIVEEVTNDTLDVFRVFRQKERIIVEFCWHLFHLSIFIGDVGME